MVPLNCSNAASPRLASSSKDCTVRVWNSATRRVEYTLGGHTATVNVVRWGGVGKGILYTAGSDRIVRVWDAEGVRRKLLSATPTNSEYLIVANQGKLLYTLKDHAHWVTTLALNTDFVLRTGPYDHLGKHPASDEEGINISTLILASPYNTFPSKRIGSCTI